MSVLHCTATTSMEKSYSAIGEYDTVYLVSLRGGLLYKVYSSSTKYSIACVPNQTSIIKNLQQ